MVSAAERVFRLTGAFVQYRKSTRAFSMDKLHCTNHLGKPAGPFLRTIIKRFLRIHCLNLCTVLAIVIGKKLLIDRLSIIHQAPNRRYPINRSYNNKRKKKQRNKESTLSPKRSPLFFFHLINNMNKSTRWKKTTKSGILHPCR